MKIIKLTYILCFFSYFLFGKVQAGVVNYYASISNFTSSNDFPQGGFIDGLVFNSSMTVNISGSTIYRVIYKDGTCSTSSKSYNWKRYLIIPESVKDSTNILTLSLTSNSERFLVGMNGGVAHYAYKIDSPNGSITGCIIGKTYSGGLVGANTKVIFQSSITKEPGTAVTAKTYSFSVPVRIVAVVDGTGNGWYSEALSYPPLEKANFPITITNFCNISQASYEFDFGSLTEGAVNESGFSKESDTKNLDINCVEPANVTLSVITANNENGNPNKVKMGDDLVADFYINNLLQNNTVFTGTDNIHIPLHAILRRNINSVNSVNSIQAGEYIGNSVIKITFQ
ncbi:hypothetical protein CHI95_17250 [Providencia rettgeri]|uniref:Fimbrial protein n=1 Tax=Providencia rettgeri TaxID=587 RepID=A0A264VR31_PRORE|nr:hypothetical protein [Providencia rettgeri]OZS73287.1 hypothetical protein CHI95_17250 [Providencia rettgeri]